MIGLKILLSTLLVLAPFLIFIILKEYLIIGYLLSFIIGITIYYFQKKYKKEYLTKGNFFMLFFISSLFLFLKTFF